MLRADCCVTEARPSRHPARLAFYLRILTLPSSALLAATLAVSAGAVELKPKVFPLTVLGVKVDVPVTISFDANTDGDALGLQLRAQASMSRADWADRIPLVGFEQIDNASREGKLYQGAMLAILTVLPLIALIHFWMVFSEAYAVTTKNPPELIPSIWSWSALTSLNDPHGFATFSTRNQGLPGRHRLFPATDQIRFCPVLNQRYSRS
jgi:hypothetical protein